MGHIWYQKKDLEKLEVRGWVLKSTDIRGHRYLQITCFIAPFLHSNLFETIPNGAEHFLPQNHLYRGLAEKNPRKPKILFSAIQKLFSGFVMALNNYSAPFLLVSDKLECKKGVLKQVICQYLCTHVSANTLNHPRTYNFTRSFF